MLSSHLASNKNDIQNMPNRRCANFLDDECCAQDFKTLKAMRHDVQEGKMSMEEVGKVLGTGGSAGPNSDAGDPK